MAAIIVVIATLTVTLATAETTVKNVYLHVNLKSLNLLATKIFIF